MRRAALLPVAMLIAVSAVAQDRFSLELESLPLDVEEPAAGIETTQSGELDLRVDSDDREVLVYRSALTPRSPKEHTLALWDAPMGRLYYSRAEAEAMLGREGLVGGGRMTGLGMATSTIGDHGQSSLGFLASGGSWSELTLGEKFAAGAEASFLAAILYALVEYAD